MEELSVRDEVERTLRALLAESLHRDTAEIERLPPQTELFGPEIALSSLAGVTLLTGITHRYGVDIADEDLNLDSLQSIATLRDFVVAHIR